MKVCDKCKTINGDDDRFCRNCGAKLPGIFALVCPNCGKVSPLGTKECPVCHTPLKQVNFQQISLVIHQQVPHPHLMKLLLVMGAIFLTVITTYYLNSTRQLKYGERATGYYEIEMHYYDRHHRFLYTNYYIINQTAKRPDTYHFPIAFIGRNNEGKRMSKGVSITRMRRQYETSRQRGKLIMRAHYTTISCPQHVKIISPRAEVYGNSMEFFAPYENRYYPVKTMHKNDSVRYTKIRIIISTAG